MTFPLAILAIGSIFAGWLGAPEYLWGSWWEHWLAPIYGSVHEAQHGALETELTLMAFTLGLIAVAILLAYLFYGRPAKAADRLSTVAGGVPYRFLLHKYYVDELYDFLVVRPFTAISRSLAQFFDPRIIDGAVNGMAASAVGLSALWRVVQSGNVQHYLIGFLVGTVAILAYYLGQQ